MTKYAMALEAKANGSHYVDQIFLFQFLLKIIDKIKGTKLCIFIKHIFSSYFSHNLDCFRVKHFVIFWKNIWLNILKMYQRVGFCWGSLNNHLGITLLFAQTPCRHN